MAKELPFFKFTPDEWLVGNITLEDYAIQGLFINICAYYWKRDCNITIAHLWQRYSSANQSHLTALFDSKIIKEDSYKNVRIMFLDEQLSELEKSKNAKSDAGRAGAAARWQTHGTPIILPMAKHGNIDIDIEKDKEYIYTLYPPRDVNNSNRSTGKTTKNKIKIQQLLKSVGKDSLEKKINWYLKDCEDTKKYLMNFGTFLNNLPEEVETPAPVKDKYNGRIPGLTYWIPS